MICLEDEVTAPAHEATSEKLKAQKSLRSLNDVLGKAAPVEKEAQTGEKS